MLKNIIKDCASVERKINTQEYSHRWRTIEKKMMISKKNTDKDGLT